MSSRLTSEIAERQVGNKFLMVLLAAQRAREISSGSTPKVSVKGTPATIALAELEAGLVDIRTMNTVGKRTIKRFRPIP